jgi:hypothetical protein
MTIIQKNKYTGNIYGIGAIGHSGVNRQVADICVFHEVYNGQFQIVSTIGVDGTYYAFAAALEPHSRDRISVSGCVSVSEALDELHTAIHQQSAEVLKPLLAWMPPTDPELKALSRSS